MTDYSANNNYAQDAQRGHPPAQTVSHQTSPASVASILLFVLVQVLNIDRPSCYVGRC